MRKQDCTFHVQQVILINTAFSQAPLDFICCLCMKQ